MRHVTLKRLAAFAVAFAAATGPVSGTAGASATVTVLSRVPTDDAVVFVTIDDGFTRSAAAASELRSLNWPVTSFPVTAALARDVRYFTGIGNPSHVANHTVGHPKLPTLSETAQRTEICTAADRTGKLTGRRPSWFRPPYGSYDRRTLRAAASCGVTHLLLWRVTVNGRRIDTWGSAPIHRGDIILLHYRPDLAVSVRALADELDRLGLHVADLGRYLAG